MGIFVDEVQNGDKNIFASLEKHNYPAGGEQTGHTLYKFVHDRTGLVLSGDGAFAAVHQAVMSERTGQTLDALSDWPKFANLQTTLVIDPKRVSEATMQLPGVLDAVEDANNKLGKQGRAHARLSGTEPKIRFTAQARDGKLAQDVLTELKAKISQYAN